MRKNFILQGLLCLLVLCFSVQAAETEQKLLGDESDGSRAHPIHRLSLYAAPAEPDYSALIDAISAAFAEGISDLSQALTSTTVLPELSEPTGNGAAYDKFFTIYNQMLGIETIQQEPTTGEGVDTIA